MKNIKGTQNNHTLPEGLVFNNQAYYETSEIIENLNHYFATISEKLKHEHPPESIPFDFTKLNTYVETKLYGNVRFHIPQMKRSDLLSIISTLDVKKATGLDGIIAKILKSSAETVCPSSLKIVNISIASGKFPNSFIPVFKSGPQNDPSNYRPISILSILSKIIEKHVTKHLFAY